MSNRAALPAPKDAIAIVGIGCRFPGGGHDAGSFWKLLADGVDAISDVPADRWDAGTFYHPDGEGGRTNSRWGGFVPDVEAFDSGFFGMSPREATRTDPQHRLLLEVSWEALEDAGLIPHQLAGSPTAVFVGISSFDYALVQADFRDRTHIDVYSNTGNALSLAANRISYQFDFKGPSAVVDTACSSSLVAVHMACRSIWDGHSQLALAGGVNVLLNPDGFIGFTKLSMLSPDGRCKAFDASANGFVRAEGVGLVVLKPLAAAVRDGDRVYAVIRSTAVNSDGRTPGLTVPDQKSQEELIRLTLREAGATPRQVRYVEAHGTGTPVGDPIETRALGTVLGAGRPANDPCLIGSVKTNIGHLEPASGIAGLIKAALVLHHGQVPPNLHFHTPNPDIPFDTLRLRVPRALEPLPPGVGPALAGVNSFGFGGTNAHVLLQEPDRPAVRATAHTGPVFVPLSARTPDALRALAKAWADALAVGEWPLNDVAYTACARRTHHEYRLPVVAKSATELADHLGRFAAGTDPVSAVGTAPKLAFVFCGQGPQWWGMGRQLLADEPVFRDTVRRCADILDGMADWSLWDELSRATEGTSRMQETVVAQPALFVLQVALAELWRSWGVTPSVVVGHSVGEVAAAHVAGALTLEEAVRVIYHRARCVEQAPSRGKMLAVGLSAAEAAEYVGHRTDRIAIAAINGPRSITLSGQGEALEEVAEALKKKDIFHRFLQVQYAFHSPQLDPVQGELTRSLLGIRPRPTTVPLYSTVTGRRIDGATLDPDYWWRNLRNTVYFADAIDRISGEGFDTFLEFGPHPVLSGSVQECLKHRSRTGKVIPTLRRGSDDRPALLRSVGELYVLNQPYDWVGLAPAGRPVPLPGYRFQREKFWFETAEARRTRAGGPCHLLLGQPVPAAYPSWEQTVGTGTHPFLNDHQAQGHPLFPATGYVEMAFAAAAAVSPDRPQALHDIKLLKACFLPEGTVKLQTVYTPDGSTFGVHTGGGGLPLTTHVTGVLRPAEEARGVALALDAVRQRCTVQYAPADYYARLSGFGLDYGPAFQGVQELWTGPNEALGRVCLPEGTGTQLTDFHVHPVVLDAGLQVIFGTLSLPAVGERRGAYLPVAIEKVTLFAKPTGPVWCHAKLTDRDRRTVTADLRVYDESGSPVCEVRGVRCQAVGADGDDGGSLDDILYEYRWQAAPRDDRPTPVTAPAAYWADLAALAESLQAEARALNAECELRVRTERFTADLNPLAVAFIARALGETGGLRTGERFTTDALADRVGVAVQHRRFFGRLLAILAEDGYLSGDGTTWEVRVVPPATAPLDLWRRMLDRHPAYQAELNLFQRCGSELAKILRGQQDPMDLIFPGGSTSTTEHLYQDSPYQRFTNAVTRRAIGRLQQLLPAGRVLRVLEVGGGTGGLTAHLLPALDPTATRYVFTDLSGHFFDAAQQKFGGYPFVEYRRLDLERDPVAQGFDAGSFDVVVVSQALHATADLRQTLGHIRQLLAAGGLLLATESITRSRFLDLVFGTLNGWWRATDRELRPDHPLLTFPQWKGVLEATGFGAVADAAATGEPMDAAVLMAVATQAGMPVPPEAGLGGTGIPACVTTDRWLVLADAGGVATQLTAALTRAGGSCVRVTVGTEFARLSADEFRVNPARPDDMKRLMAEATVGQALRGVVHLWNLDAPPTDGLSGAALDAAQTAGCLSIVHLLHVWGPDAKPGTRWWVITRGAHRVGGEPGPVAVAQAPAWGLVRAIGREYSHLKCGLIDLDAAPATAAAECILAELASPTADDELAFRGATRFAHRYVRAPLDDRPINATGRAYRLEVARSNTLDGLRLRTTTTRPPGPGEVGIEVVAAGLNFSDVLKALGLYPGLPVGPVPLGIECSGRITAVGEGVTGFAPGDAVAAVTTHTFSSHLNAPAVAVGHMPKGVSFEEAATIPIAFLTAHYALNHMGRMEPGERVLIHSATGGVGLAAIQIARAGGAEVFATAGSKEKRELLRALGVPHVFDSRSLAFIDEIHDRTGGHGVDLVLNSLSGEALTRGMGVLGDHGRFLEIGKRDIYADTRMPLRTFRKNLSFMAIDLDRALRERPERIGGLYRDLLKEFDRGVLHPLPHRTFAAGDAAAAFRTMAQAKHVGKVLLNLTDTGGQVRAAVGETAELRADRTYLVVGGAGGFGMAVTDWLVASGAKHVMLVGRRTTLPPDTTAAIDRLRQTGARVEAVSADVTDAAQVAGLLARTGGEWPTLAGVIHTAMVLDDCLLMNLTADRLTKVLRPKVLGAWHLHTQTADRPLDFFVMFSSMSSVFGLAGQANYAAANAFLDALAHHRRALGLPATTVNWGALGGVGYVAEHKDVAAKFDTMGIRHFTPQEAVSLLGRFIRQGVTQIGVMRVDWRKLARSLYGEAVPPRFTGLLDAVPGGTTATNQAADVGVRASVLQAPPEKRKETLQKLVRERLAKVLGTVEEKVSTEIPLVSLGVDSLMAVELHNWIEGELRVSLPIVELVRGPSVSKLADVLLAQLTAGEADTPTTPTPTVEVAPPAPVELPPAETGEPFPCTDLQVAYLGARWIDSELGKRGCHISVEIAVDRPLDVAHLSAAWQQLLNRQPTTRLVFTKKMTQRVLPAAEYALPTDDWRDDPQAEMKLAALRQRLADQVFDPTAWPLFEVRVVRLGEQSFRLFASLDMLVVDMQSLHLLLGDWLALYDGTAGPVADVDAFRRYALQTAEVRGTPAHTRDCDYWAARVADFPPPPPLPLRGDPAALRRPRFGTAGVRLTADQWAQLRTRARKNDLTPAGLLAAAFARILAQWSGAERFCLNLPVNDRTAAQQPLIGPYTSTLLLDVNTAGDFWTSARTLHGTLLDGIEHNRCTGIEFTRMIARHRKSGLRPITPVVFTSMLYPSPLAGWGRVVDAYSQTPQVWLDCQVVDDDGALWVRWDYVEQLFDADELKARLNEYGALLERLAATGSADVHTDPDLVDLFRAQVKLDPTRPAVVTDSGTVSYVELDAESDRVASGLIAAGVKPGHLVAVCCPTSPALVSALLGIHKAGAAYLPLDPDLPPARIAELLTDSRAEHIVSDPTLADRWPVGRSPLALSTLATTPAGPLPTPRGADAVAYVIYTSGSTGRPKGVVMTHAAVVNTIEEVNRRFEVGPSDRVFAFSRLTFDLSVYDIFGTLAAGAAVVLPADTSRREPRHWLAAVRKHHVTVWNSVPSAMEMLVAVAERTPGVDRLRCVLLSGDWVPVSLPDRIRSQFTAARVVSLGGATECAIWSCFHPVNGITAEWKSIPYGRPLGGQTLHVLGDDLRPVPAGAAGQLFIGGRGLAAGYLHDPDRTTAAFVSLPGTNGHAERVYRTGDRARVLPNGEVEFLGRGDGQVKVRGYRVELAEVEAALARHPAVKQCAVVALGESGGPRELAAYYSLSSPVGDAVLRTHLTDTLPEYMVPQHWTELPTLPLNGNGKVDRKGLHHPRATSTVPPNGILLDPRERATFRAAGHGIRRDLNGSLRVPLATPEPDALSAWIEARHSQREFGTRPVAAHQFAKLLHALRVRGEAGKRNYASAGGTYSVQLYLHLKAGAVEGLDAGTYYYQPEDHHLARLSDRADLGEAIHFPTNRPLARHAAFTLFLVSRLSAVTPLYGDIARPLATLEAGAVSHLLETLAPHCAVGLCQVSAVNMDPVRDAFALDADHVLLHTLVGGSLPTADDTAAHHELHAAPPTPVVVPTALPLAAGEIQAELVRMWKQTLEVDAVDVHASFFELGGDSLRAMNLMVQLQDRFGVEVNVADLYTHSTLADLAAFIATAPKASGVEAPAQHERNGEAATTDPGARASRPLSHHNESPRQNGQPLPHFASITERWQESGRDARAPGFVIAPSAHAPHANPDVPAVRTEDVAVIGLVGRLPGGPDLDAFWDTLRNGRSTVRPVPPERAALVPGFATAPPDTFRASYIDDIDQFDPQFFRLSPREAKRIDPGQRLLLMTCHELLESTGYGGKALAGKRTGVFVAGGGGEYWQLAREVPGLDDLRKFILGSMPSVLANRVSHALNLSGPSLTVDTSCSSSLVAVDLACQSLRAGDCETAVVAAANLILSPGVFTAFRQDGMEAKGGQCRTFDAGGDGFVRGEGVAAVLLKPLHKALADGDTVHAVIKGTAVNHDGRMNALEIPNPQSQAEVIALAHRRAGTSPDTIDYVEAHGTGTALGDPIEFGGLKKAFAGVRPAACGVGSVKSNVGHLEYAAGLAGLVKVILALRHNELPPSLHFRAPNPHLDFSDSPFYLVDRPRAWVRNGRPRRAAVSSFGMGGTNAHVIVEEPPLARPTPPRTGLELFVLSARSETALSELTERFRRKLESPGDVKLADVCGTVALGRTHFAHRLAVVADSLPTVVKALAHFRAGVKTIPATMWSGTTGESVTTADRPATAVAGAEAYVRGAEPQWPHLFAGRRVALPTYPYQTSSCWLDVPPPAAHTSPLVGEVGGTAGSAGWGVSQQAVTPAVLPSAADVEALLIGELAKVLELPAEHILPEVPFFELGVDSITAVELIRRLEAHTGQSLSPTLFFDAPTVRKLADVLLREHGDALAVSSPEPQAVVSPTVSTSIGDGSAPVAVIGMAGRFPGAPDLNSFWRNLRDGVDSVTEVPADRWDVDRHYTTDRTQVGKTYTRWGGFLTDLDQFDALFFRSSPREARWFDPQQRLLLETAWEALEDAGHAGKTRPKDRCGVFVGATHYHFRDMMLRQADAVPDAGVALGNSSAILANRLSYFLDLRGPSLTIDTLCSSSLVAVHMAVTSLRRGECDTAIVAGVHAGMSPMYYQAISRLQAASAVGRCQSFGSGADGYVPAEGVGVIVLKRQADAEAAGDQIHGVIRGSAANHGGQSAGLTVPSASGQAAVVRAALLDAGVKAEQLDYVEAHGTGTSLGDPIEVRGLAQVFPPGARQVCGIGSLKSNIGHLEPAAGIGSLIKVLLALRADEFPPSLHLSEVNPLISFEETPFFFVDRRRAWVRNGVPRRAGVSSFGLGGSNAHVVVEDAPPVPRPPDTPGTPHLLVLSARSATGLDRLADAYARHLDANPGVELRDVCFTAAVGRAHFPHRLAVLATTRDELARRLREPADDRSVWRGHATGTPPAPPTAAGLSAVARAYVAGADVSADIAPDGRRVSLPTFPFDRVTCRVQEADAPSAVQQPTPPARKPHPLLGTAAVQPDGAVVFEHTFGIRPRPEGTQ